MEVWITKIEKWNSIRFHILSQFPQLFFYSLVCFLLFSSDFVFVLSSFRL